MVDVDCPIPISTHSSKEKHRRTDGRARFQLSTHLTCRMKEQRLRIHRAYHACFNPLLTLGSKESQWPLDSEPIRMFQPIFFDEEERVAHCACPSQIMVSTHLLKEGTLDTSGTEVRRWAFQPTSFLRRRRACSLNQAAFQRMFQPIFLTEGRRNFPTELIDHSCQVSTHLPTGGRRNDYHPESVSARQIVKTSTPCGLAAGSHSVLRSARSAHVNCPAQRTRHISEIKDEMPAGTQDWFRRFRHGLEAQGNLSPHAFFECLPAVVAAPDDMNLAWRDGKPTAEAVVHG